MQINFYKYHGTGNDFVLIDNLEKKIKLSKKQINLICDRHIGVGADGLMLLESAKGYDFKMVYFNSDGNQSTMCGNGGRCIVKFAHDLKLIKSSALFLAIDGEHTASIKGNLVKLKMIDVDKVEKRKNHFFVNTGSPHYITLVEDVKNIDVFERGRKIRNSAHYRKEGINVNFVSLDKENEISVRTYERGVENETLSCGTGVTAATLAAATIKGFDKKCKVNTPGGKLTVHFKKAAQGFKDIFLEGPAEFVFNGSLKI